MQDCKPMARQIMSQTIGEGAEILWRVKSFSMSVSALVVARIRGFNGTNY